MRLSVDLWDSQKSCHLRLGEKSRPSKSRNNNLSKRSQTSSLACKMHQSGRETPLNNGRPSLSTRCRNWKFKIKGSNTESSRQPNKLRSTTRCCKLRQLCSKVAVSSYQATQMPKLSCLLMAQLSHQHHKAKTL